MGDGESREPGEGPGCVPSLQCGPEGVPFHAEPHVLILLMIKLD